MKKLITVIIPAYNEEKSLPSLFKRLDSLSNKIRDYRLEFLFINDGSRDNTLKILQQEADKNPQVSYLSFSRNFGKEIGVAAGLDHADGDAVIIIDADGQQPPELIPEMIKWWEKGFDDVYARRNAKKDSGLRKVTSKIYYRTLQKMTRVPIQIDTGDFRLFSRRCVLALRQFREASRQNKAIFSWVGYRKKEITYDDTARVQGETKWSFGLLREQNSLINLAIDGFTSFTTIPLRLITLVGLFISFVSFVYIIVVIVQTILDPNHIAGLPTVLCAVLFLGGVQMIALGIIGEYVGRIFTETKNRPLYLVDEYHKAKVARGINNDHETKKLD